MSIEDDPIIHFSIKRNKLVQLSSSPEMVHLDALFYANVIFKCSQPDSIVPPGRKWVIAIEGCKTMFITPGYDAIKIKNDTREIVKVTSSKKVKNGILLPGQSSEFVEDEDGWYTF
jgi:hypothetical protein